MGKRSKAPVDSPLDPPPCKLRDCALCDCRKEARQPVGGRGNVNGRVAIVGQNPGGQEDTDCKVFVGQSGFELKSWMEILGLRQDDVWLTNVVKCHTEKNRAPKAVEIKKCRDTWLVREVIKLPNLRAIIPLGEIAASAILGKDNRVKIGEASKAVIKDALDRELVVFPIYHPAYFFRNQGDKPYHLEIVLPELRRELVQMGIVEALA